MQVILDTNIFIDMYLAHRPNHEDAMRLSERLVALNAEAIIPAHAYFELMGAICSEHKHNSYQPVQLGKINGELPFRQKLVYIDNDFLKKYLFDGVLLRNKQMYLKGGDLIFVSMASVLKIPLVTRDNAMTQQARSHNVAVMNIIEFLTTY